MIVEQQTDLAKIQHSLATLQRGEEVYWVVFNLLCCFFFAVRSIILIVLYCERFEPRSHLESWFTNLEQTPLNRSQQLPALYKRLIDEIKQN